MGLIARLFGKENDRESMRGLYNDVIRMGRDPEWYAPGAVPDSVDGRFEAIAMALSLTLLRIEKEPDADRALAQKSVWLTELFIDDMDGQLREFGVGDVVVGKRIGKMIGALGGRLGAYRDGLAGAEAGDMAALDGALERNLLGTAPFDAEALPAVRTRVLALQAWLAAVPVADLVMGGMLGEAA